MTPSITVPIAQDARPQSALTDAAQLPLTATQQRIEMHCNVLPTASCAVAWNYLMNVRRTKGTARMSIGWFLFCRID